jgi:transposase
VGIDVGAKELVVKIQPEGADIIEKRVSNDQAGHKKLIGYLNKTKSEVKVGLEATGIYYLNVALALHRVGFSVMVVNPRAIKNFAKAMMKRAKTDRVDADVILNYVQRMPFQAWEPPCVTILQLQTIARRIRQLKKEVTREKNRYHAIHYCDEAMVVKKDLEENIQQIEKRVKDLVRQARELISSEPTLHHKFQLLCSTKGIAEMSALCILSEILVLPPDMQAEQWVAYCGLDPKAKESGTSLNCPRHISKTGNYYLRSALYIPALVAIQFDPNIQAFYEKLVARGKKKLQAIVAVMRKLLHCIWGMFKYDQPFDGSKFFRIPVNSTS